MESGRQGAQSSSPIISHKVKTACIGRCPGPRWQAEMATLYGKVTVTGCGQYIQVPSVGYNWGTAV